MGWTNLSFGFNEVLASAKLNLLQDNLVALATGAVGAPSIQHKAITTHTAQVIRSDDFSLNASSYLQRTGGAFSLITSGAVIISVRSTWRSNANANIYGRINRDSGTEYRAFGSILSNGAQTLFLGGSALFTGLSAGSHDFGFEVRCDSGQAQNLCGSLGEWFCFEMFGLEV